MKTLQTYLPSLTKLAIFSLFMLLVPNQLYAAGEATFSWTANPEPLTGYMLYYKTGTSGEPYDGTGLTVGDPATPVNSPIPVDKTVTTYTVSGLSADVTYYFALTAINGEEESDYSEIAIVNSDPAPVIMNMFLQ